MRNKVAKIIAIVLILYLEEHIYNKLTKPNLGPRKTNLSNSSAWAFVCWRAIEPYIKEHYRGIERLNFPNIHYQRKGQYSQMRTCVQLFMISMEIRLPCELQLIT